MYEQWSKQSITTMVVAVMFFAMWVVPLSPLRGGRGYPSQLVLAAVHDEALSQGSPGELSAESVIARLVEANRLRDAALQHYTASRTFRAVNLRFNKKAKMQAVVRFERPATKRFTILWEEGSEAIRKMVFRGVMEAEQDALNPEMKRRSAINLDNYRFKLVGGEDIEDHHCYVLDAEPRRADKYLFLGRVWIDARDFAVVRIKGSPAKMPSFWTRKVEFVRENQKIRNFWLPARDESVSQIFIFGKSYLVVEHFNYQVEGLSDGN